MNSLVNSWQQVLFAGIRPNIGLIIFMELDFGVFRVKRPCWLSNSKYVKTKSEKKTAKSNG